MSTLELELEQFNTIEELENTLENIKTIEIIHPQVKNDPIARHKATKTFIGIWVKS